METSDFGLKFIRLDVSLVQVIVLSSASFANESGMNRQLAFVVITLASHYRADTVHYGSRKCDRVARSVMAAEVRAVLYAFDHAYIVQEIIAWWMISLWIIARGIGRQSHVVQCYCEVQRNGGIEATDRMFCAEEKLQERRIKTKWMNTGK